MGKVSQSEILIYCIQQYIPFAIYKLPNEDTNVLIVSKTVDETDLEGLFARSEDIFTVAPFSCSQNKTVCFKCDYEIEVEAEESVFNEIRQIKTHPEIRDELPFSATYTDYKKQFEQLFSEIKTGRISKAILSRIKQISDIGKELAADFYYKLSVAYPKAYTFMVYTPQTGLWTGASPELLFKTENGEGTTVSLAGTQRNSDLIKAKWSEKEIDEQKIVTDFVKDILLKYGISNTRINGPETIVAGKMSHLKTQYIFPVKQVVNVLGRFINDLHPTPAVCGLPKNESMQVISEVEKHERSYYAGFLGRIQSNNIKLFVNIRSMKFVDKGVDLYLGGGITAGSEAEKEWQETELKAGTMMSVIEKLG